jgi:hypothetical protein
LTLATLCALLLLAAGLLHSYSFMCRKLPPGRRPGFYPRRRNLQLAIDALWITLFLAALVLAFVLSVRLGIVAILLYFLALPFALQPPLARLLGFRSLRHYLEEIDKHLQNQ